MEQDALKRHLLNVVKPIKQLRLRNGLTQVEFAKRAGVGLRFVRSVEQGKITVRTDKLMQILDFLGYHLELKKNEPF
ncbi:MAG: helix-turn-helix domain-containing protein [Pseudomonadota bacterium]